MGAQAKYRPWWDGLKLDPATAQVVAGRDPDSPAVLAEDVRRFTDVFKPAVRADLTRAVTAHLATKPKDQAGYQDLLEALEEVAGQRPRKELPEPNLHFGLAESPVPVQEAPPPPVPRNLPQRKPGGQD